MGSECKVTKKALILCARTRERERASERRLWPAASTYASTDTSEERRRE